MRTASIGKGFTGRYVLHEYMSYEWTCIIEIHELKWDMSYWKAYSTCEQFHGTACYEDGHHYWKVCGSGNLVYHEFFSYGRTCPVGGHVLQVCSEAATIEATVSLGSWCFYFLYFFLFFALRQHFNDLLFKISFLSM